MSAGLAAKGAVVARTKSGEVSHGASPHKMGVDVSQGCSDAASAGSYRDPTGAGGIGAPSRSAFVDRRVLLTPDSLAGLFLLSLPPSGEFFASSPFFGTKAGLKANGWGATPAPASGRGHEKSSARPACASKVSPWVKTFSATGSDDSCFWWSPAPRRTSCSPSPMDSGKTGPTSGLAPVDSDFGVVSGPGSATGATLLGVTRRSSRST